MWAKDALGAIADLLFMPVVIGLIGVVIWTMISVGLFLRSFIGRARGRRPAGLDPQPGPVGRSG